jgi:hypothetical protein
MAKRGGRWPESSPLSCIVSGVRESRSAGRRTPEPPDSIVRKIHPSKIADGMVARRARDRVAASVGLERRHCMPARCGHFPRARPDQMESFERGRSSKSERWSRSESNKAGNFFKGLLQGQFINGALSCGFEIRCAKVAVRNASPVGMTAPMIRASLLARATVTSGLRQLNCRK